MQAGVNVNKTWASFPCGHWAPLFCSIQFSILIKFFNKSWASFSIFNKTWASFSCGHWAPLFCSIQFSILEKVERLFRPDTEPLCFTQEIQCSMFGIASLAHPVSSEECDRHFRPVQVFYTSNKKHQVGTFGKQSFCTKKKRWRFCEI